MSGAQVIGKLLSEARSLAERPRPVSVGLGRIAPKTGIPLLLVRTVSVVERQPLKRGGWVRVTERVSVAIRAESYRDLKAILGLVNGLCVGVHGDVLDVARNVSILSAGVGPDVDGPADSFEQTHDFRASFDAPVTASPAGA